MSPMTSENRFTNYDRAMAADDILTANDIATGRYSGTLKKHVDRRETYQAHGPDFLKMKRKMELKMKRMM